VDPGETLPAGWLAAMTHGTGHPRVSAPGLPAALRLQGQDPAGCSALHSGAERSRHGAWERGERADVWSCSPACTTGAGPRPHRLRCRAGKRPAVPRLRAAAPALPRAAQPPTAVQRPWSSWDKAAAARCINDLEQKKPGVGLIARKTAELQSSRNKSGWKWSSSEDGAAGAEQP